MKRVERQLQGELYHIVKEALSSRRITRIDAKIEEGRADIYFLDVDTGRTIVFFELKDPAAPDGRSVINPDIINRESDRAKRLKAGGFGITNFVEIMYMDIRERAPRVDLPRDKFVDRAHIERYRKDRKLFKELKDGLRRLANYMIDRAVDVLQETYTGIKPVDESIVILLRAIIETHSPAIASALEEHYRKDAKFKEELDRWLLRQMWHIPTTYQDFERLAHLSLLMLTSRLIFYKAVYDSHLYDLPPLKMDRQTSDPLYFLQHNFFDVLIEKTGDFENLVGSGSDPMARIPFLNRDAGVSFANEIITTENLYDFSKLSYDIVGRVFEGLLNEEERHKMGQYFTPPQVVDLINAFVIKKEDQRVMDPTCGSGAFLVRAYMRKKGLSDGRRGHFELLKELYGFDISDYAVQLATLNLAIRDLRLPAPEMIKEDFVPYPRVFREDFFDVYPGRKLKFPHRNIVVEVPHFDVVIGNPPYTRQEELSAEEKEKIFSMLSRDWQGFSPSKRTSLYALVLYHASAFLREGGYLGFIISNSWLDTGYGEEVQKFLLDRFRIIAVIDSKVERFFPDADINTSIVILRRESDSFARDSNLVRFVYLKKPLKEIISHYDGYYNFAEAILRFREPVDNDFIRIRPVVQKELYDDTKWGKYLRAGSVYWRIMERGEWIPLKEVANIRFGIKTGDNNFFYLRDITDEATVHVLAAARNNRGRIRDFETLKRRNLRIVENGYKEVFLIESDLLKPVVKSPREVKKYVIEPEDLTYRVFLVGRIKEFQNPETGRYDTARYEEFMRKNYPFAWEYIKWGEERGIHDKPTTRSRPVWWDLGDWKPADLIIPCSFRDRFPIILNQFNILEDKRLYGIKLKDGVDLHKLFTFMTSTLFWFLIENFTRNYGGGGGPIDATVEEIQEIMIPKSLNLNHRLVEDKGIINFPISSVFDELGAREPEEVDLSRVAPHRLELDRAVLEAIGFTDPKERDEVLLELYRELIDLVKSRLEKAKSVSKRGRSRAKLNAQALAAEVERRLEMEPERSTRFLQHLKEKIAAISPDEKMQKRILKILWKQLIGEDKVPTEKQLEKLF